MSLTDTAVRNAKPTLKVYKLTDSHGLHIEIKPNGKKFWRYRYRIAGKENLFAIGEFRNDKTDKKHVSLAEARSLRDEARKLVKQGIHPSHHRKAQLESQIEENKNTFEYLAMMWFDDTRQKKGWSEHYVGQISTTFKKDVFPVFGSLPIPFVTADHIGRMLDRIESRGAAVQAILARQWCSAVFRYAIRKRRVEVDPTTAFKGEIKKPTVTHSKPLSLDEIPVFLRVLDGYGGRVETTIALKLLMLTLVRTKELREATWQEFDLDGGIWRIPDHRMKMRREHVVPLSSQAVKLLNTLHSLTGHGELLFPSSRRPDVPIAATTLNRALEYMGYAGKFSCHGFRATGSTLLNERGYRADVIEVSLAHQERNSVRRAYNQSDYLAERKQMLQDWADYLDGLKSGAKVLPLRKNGTSS